MMPFLRNFYGVGSLGGHNFSDTAPEVVMFMALPPERRGAALLSCLRSQRVAQRQRADDALRLAQPIPYFGLQPPEALIGIHD